MLHRHDELLPGRDVKQLGPEGMPRQWPEFGQKSSLIAGQS